MWPFSRRGKSPARSAAIDWERRALKLLSRLELLASDLERIRMEALSTLDESSVLSSDARRHIEDHQRVNDMLKAELDVEKSTVEALVLHDKLMQERTKADIDIQMRRQVAFSMREGQE